MTLKVAAPPAEWVTELRVSRTAIGEDAIARTFNEALRALRITCSITARLRRELPHEQITWHRRI